MPGCTFQQRWLFTDQFKSWIQESKSINYATCKFCKKDIDLKGMGESALKSHANGKKHQDHAKSNQNSEKTSSFITWTGNRGAGIFREQRNQ